MATNGNVNSFNNSGWNFFNPPRFLVVSSGNYSVSGKPATLVKAAATREIQAGAGIYAVNGKSVTFAKPRKVLYAGSGIYALSGKDASFGFPNRILRASSGFYSVAGQDVVFFSSSDKTHNVDGDHNSGWIFSVAPRILYAGSGNYSISGKSANIVKAANKLLIAEKGEYVLVGNPATINFAGNFSLSGPTLRYADFFRLTTSNGVYLFSTAPFAITVPSVSPDPFTALGQLIKVGGAQRDIKSTANETTITLVGIDTAMLGLVLSEKIKGSKIELWHGFFNSQNQLVTASGTGLYKYFSGYVNTFSISEEWMEEARSFAGAITISASSFQLILQNRNSGRYTNDAAWKAVNSTDTSMNRVNFISTINYAFGKTPT